MPYCNQCGSAVRDTDQFCAKCGQAQVGSAPKADFMSGMTERHASMFSYTPYIGWVIAIVVLASARFRHNESVRFHAFQGLYLFVACLIMRWVLSPMIRFSDGFPMDDFFRHIPELAVIALGVFMMVKLSNGQSYRLPLIGELAERSVSEQR